MSDLEAGAFNCVLRVLHQCAFPAHMPCMSCSSVTDCRAEYDERMLPRVWWVDLETPEQRETALAWDGSYVVRFTSSSVRMPPLYVLGYSSIDTDGASIKQCARADLARGGVQ